ncbi:hypothetical protein EYF80_050738 [Liparis tanakae]|uniref:Uncharacterized protein n=1 Tax=Liparis tanakae TaxID=230148 RepID=A0A4Z2FE99_9TELE|nr:hypothetical protein EYF80_050738 [Liparis tanakae]
MSSSQERKRTDIIIIIITGQAQSMMGDKIITKINTTTYGTETARGQRRGRSLFQPISTGPSSLKLNPLRAALAVRPPNTPDFLSASVY